ncbi:MAG: hypothetical protein GWN58_44695, partial [Anaerolineae bacterium]|nr:hypothetical protein [Anaerolineae bacterium]
PYADFVHSETRFDMLWGTQPETAEAYLQRAQEEVLHRYQHYQHLASIPWDDPEELARARAKLIRPHKESPS